MSLNFSQIREYLDLLLDPDSSETDKNNASRKLEIIIRENDLRIDLSALIEDYAPVAVEAHEDEFSFDDAFETPGDHRSSSTLKQDLAIAREKIILHFLLARIQSATTLSCNSLLNYYQILSDAVINSSVKEDDAYKAIIKKFATLLKPELIQGELNALLTSHDADSDLTKLKQLVHLARLTNCSSVVSTIILNTLRDFIFEKKLATDADFDLAQKIFSSFCQPEGDVFYKDLYRKLIKYFY